MLRFISHFSKLSLKYLLYLFLFCSVYQLSSQTGNSQKIKSQLIELRSRPDFEPSDIKHIDLLVELGRSLVYIKSDTLLLLGTEIKDLSEASNYDEGLVKAELIQASSYAFTENSAQAITQCDKAIALGLKKKSYGLVAQGYSLKGMSWFKLNNYAESYMSFQKALTYAKKVKDKTLISAIYMNMATMFSLLEDYDEALSIYRKALDIELNQKVPNRVLRSQIRSNIAFLEVNIAEYENALNNVNTSIVAFMKESKPAWLAFCYNIKGKVFLEKKMYSKALQIFNKSKIIHDSIQDIKGLADVHLSFSRVYYGLKEVDQAEQNALKSLKLYREVNLRTGILDTYRVLSKIKEQKKSPEEALFYLKKAQELSDTVSKNDKSSKVSLIRAKALFDEKQNQTEKENLAKIETQKKYIYIVFLALIGSLLFLFLIYKANNKVKRVNKELAEQSRILEESKKSLQEINTMKDKLFSIIGHDFRGPIVNLKQLLLLASQENLKPSEFKKALFKLSDHVDIIHFTLDNLLSWGKTQMKGFETSPERVYVENVTLNNIALFKEQIAKKNLSVVIRFEKEHAVIADKNHVDLIIRNLLNNAIKFSFTNGEIDVRGHIEEDQLLIRIRDNGVGFQPELLKQLLLENKHYSTYGTANEKGTGLGLLFCKEALKANKGKLWIESEPNIKTVVFFSLPLASMSSKQSEAQESAFHSTPK